MRAWTLSQIIMAARQRSNIQRRHPAPGARAMGASIPDMQLMADILLVQQVSEPAIIVEKGIGRPHGQDDVHPAEISQNPWAGKARQKMHGRVEIDVVTVIAIE